MAQLALPDLDDDLVRRLHQRAARHGRTPEEDLRLILEQTLHREATDFWERARRLRERIGPQKTDSTELIREERDRRAGLVE